MAYVERKEPPARPNPQKRNIIINRLVKAPWWFLMILGLLFYIYGQWSDDVIYQSIWTSVKQGVETTIFVSVRAYGYALVFGLILALMRMSNNIFFYQISTFFVEIVRGIPTLVLVLYFSLAITPLIAEQLNIVGGWMTLWAIDADLGYGIEIQGQNLDLWDKGTYLAELRTRDIEQTDRAIAALALSYSAFLSEVFRAGIQGIEKGQIEAAQSLGLRRFQILRLIVLPQAFRLILPPLGNDFIAMLKESSLVSVLGVEDVTRRGQTSAAANFRFFETYNIVALTYLVLTLGLAIGVKLIEAYLNSGRRISIYNLRHQLTTGGRTLFRRVRGFTIVEVNTEYSDGDW